MKIYVYQLKYHDHIMFLKFSVKFRFANKESLVNIPYLVTILFQDLEIRWVAANLLKRILSELSEKYCSQDVDNLCLKTKILSPSMFQGQLKSN